MVTQLFQWNHLIQKHRRFFFIQYAAIKKLSSFSRKVYLWLGLYCCFNSRPIDACQKYFKRTTPSRGLFSEIIWSKHIDALFSFNTLLIKLSNFSRKAYLWLGLHCCFSIEPIDSAVVGVRFENVLKSIIQEIMWPSVIDNVRPCHLF